MEMTKSGNIQFKTTPYRWVILMTFCGLFVNLTMAIVGLSGYVAQIKTAFGVDKWAVIFLITLPTVLYAPMNFAAAWAFAHYKVHHVLIMSAIL